METEVRADEPVRWLSTALVTFAVVIAAQYLVVQNGALGMGQSAALRTLVPALVLLGPMLVAALIVTWGTGPRSATRLLGLRIGIADPFLGVGIGALLRAATALITLALLGSTGLGKQVVLGEIDVWFYISALVIPVFVTPVIEEVYFRGVLQRATIAGLARVIPRGLAAGVGVAATALLFTAAHPVSTENGLVALNSALIIFCLGLVAGTLAALTRRIGMSIITHVTFNAVAVWMTWPL